MQFHENVQELSKRFISLNVTVNLYGVNAFEMDSAGLASWRALSHLTGGKLEKIVLKHNPAQEITFFQETLQRSFVQKYATNAILKLRTSPNLVYSFEQDVSGCLYTKHSSDSLTGHGHGNGSNLAASVSEKVRVTRSASTELPGGSIAAGGGVPGIYCVPSLTEDSTYGFKFQVQDVDTSEASNDYDAVYHAKQQRSNHKQYVFLQFAFAYETLVESAGQPETLEATSRDEVESHPLPCHRVLDSSLDTRDQSQYLGAVCQQLGLDCDELLRQQNLPAAEVFERKGKYFNRHYRHVCPYRHSSPLEVVKHLRIITYAIPCSGNLHEIEANLLIPNVLSLILKDLYSRSFHDIPANSNEWALFYSPSGPAPFLSDPSSSQEQPPQQQPAADPSPMVSERSGRLLDPSPLSHESKDPAVQRLIRRFARSALSENALLNYAVVLLEKKLELLRNEFEFSKFSGKQLVTEVIFNESMIQTSLAINNIHNLLFLLYSFLIFSAHCQDKDGRDLDDDADQQAAPAKGRGLGRGKGYTDDLVVFWSKVNYFQSSVLRRLVVPNLIALAEVGEAAGNGSAVAAGKKKKDEPPPQDKKPAVVAATVAQVPDLPLAPAPVPAAVGGLLKGSAPLHVIAASEETEGAGLLLPATPVANSSPAPVPAPAQKPQEPPDPPAPVASQFPFPSQQPQQPEKAAATSFYLKQQYLSLTRDSLVGAGCSTFLLDAGTELLLYRSLLHGADGKDSGEESSRSEGRSLITYLIHRFYEYPLVPRVAVTQAGTESAHSFTQFFLLDASHVSYHTPFTFHQFLAMLKELLTVTVE